MNLSKFKEAVAVIQSSDTPLSQRAMNAIWVGGNVGLLLDEIEYQQSEVKRYRAVLKQIAEDNLDCSPRQAARAALYGYRIRNYIGRDIGRK